MYVCTSFFLAMNIINKLPYFIVAGFAWIVIISSCANQGMPVGGPQDTIPPVLVETRPEFKSVGFDGNEIQLTFNEFIVPDLISEVLVVSPPLEKRPTILTKSKTLIVRFNEELKDSVTYSLDFKNSVVDNNERNPYENLRFIFSTGQELDSLRIAGKVIDAFDLEPVENTLVLLHKNLHDSAVYTLLPDYIARTDEEGMYLFDNLAKDEYRIYSINDINNNMRYDEGVEPIAFLDSVIVPSAEFHENVDSLSAKDDTLLLNGVDSMLVTGFVHFYPGPVYLRQFTEKIFNQYLKTSNRNSKYTCTFVFNEPVRDSFNVQLTETEATDWYILEPNQQYDSLTMWITDTTLAAQETIMMELSYFQLDSANQLFVQKDTVEMQFADKTDDSRRKRRDRNEEDEGPPPVPQFTWETNLSSIFDLNKDILLTAPQPLDSINQEEISLYLTQDTLKTPLSFQITKDTGAWRTYRISYPWEEETSYTFEIDSAAAVNIYGLTSKKLETRFKTRPEDYYGTVNLELTNVTTPVLVQLLRNNDDETLVSEKPVNKNQSVVFDFLPPEKYILKIVYNENNNGKWDTGSFQDNYQPERVAYINEVLKIRSNWEKNIPWNLEPDSTFTKNIIDVELIEQQRREAEKNARRDQEQMMEPPTDQQDDIYQDNGSPGSRQPFR